ncbi:MAG TPA: CotH kinase family protein, partial [Planctomycetota bacterium]|nr:CotH kinase family protein [Planctomycetota bacterium]
RLLAILVLPALVCPAQKTPANGSRKPDEADVFFTKGIIPRLEITLADEDLARIREKPREYVRAKVVENGRTTFADVGLKLKGAAGSFREWDDRPALTLRMDKYGGEAAFHGLKKFHLNNSVQDSTYLHEWLGSHIFRSGKIPAARVSHARVLLNGRDMGLYVLKEGFNEDFLSRSGRNPEGNLYDGGFCQDIDQKLNRNAGNQKNERADLKALHAAAIEQDLALRWKRTGELIDVPEFLTFVALELMTGHWDGYALNRNNYRVYFDPTSGKASFLPHGMDQIFGDPNASILDQPGAFVAAAVLKRPEWRTAFRKRMKELLPLFSADRLTARVEEVADRLQPVLLAMNAEEARAHEQRVRELVNRLTARERSLKEQVNLPEPKPLAFRRNSPLVLTNWRPASESDDARLEELKIAGDRVYSIEGGKSGRCLASWRRSVLLAKGRYRFSTVASVREVVALTEEDAPGSLVGLRTSGTKREGGLGGTASLKNLTFEFEVEEDMRDVELVAEIRAKSGRVTFQVGSMKLTRLSP